ncbi:ABC transporter substrate-binding protein [Comamonas odontotermitis]|uniref:ABC transporter substrate-binding protein n=1 Tax=Comamonas odontotermitis TaxID=379895 RepID=UPI00366B3324
MQNFESKYLSKRLSRRLLLKTSSAIVSGVPCLSRSQSDSIKVGATFAISGVEAASGQGLLQGAQACFNAVNKSGGINGRRIEFLVEDDEFSPSKAKQNTIKFSSDPSVVALLQPMGAEQINEVMSEGYNLPIVGPNSGVANLHRHSPGNVFWVRCTYSEELDRLVRFAENLSLRRIALVYPDDIFGRSVLEGFSAALSKRNISVAGIASTPSTTSLNVQPAAQALAAASAQVLIIALVGTLPAFETAYRAAGGTAITFGLSVGGNSKNLALLSKRANRTIFSIVVPAPNSEKFIIARQYRADMHASKFAEHSLISMEGYTNARVLIEGIRRAGQKISREGIALGLESMTNFDIGDLRIRYGKNVREGNNYIDVVMVDNNGKIVS